MWDWEEKKELGKKFDKFVNAYCGLKTQKKSHFLKYTIASEASNSEVKSKIGMRLFW